VDDSRSGGSGPTIRFFQTKKWSPIKFRREWIDEFIEANSRSEASITAAPAKRRKTPPTKASMQFELDLSRLEEWPS
jgi:hypothetical protein